MPVDLVAVFKMAQQEQCDIICLDCDGMRVEGLPEYEW